MKFVALLAITGVCMSSCVVDDFNNMAEGFSPISPTQAAIMAVDQYNADERRTGITLLANSTFGGAPEYVSLYRDYVLEDSDPLVRAASIKALARFGTSDDALLIAPWLDIRIESSAQVRRASAIALQRLHNPAVINTLLLSLRNTEEEGQVRASVATALGQYPENRVFIALISALQAPDLAIDLSAAQSLHSLTGQVFGIDWDAWFEWGELIVQERGDIFEHMAKYEYPTYQHQERWWDKLAFWEYRIHETPGSPSGIEGGGPRSTYDEEEDVLQ